MRVLEPVRTPIRKQTAMLESLTTTNASKVKPRRRRRWLRDTAVAGILILFAVELVLGWPALTSALSKLEAPRPGWLAAALVAEIAAMRAYARMQRRLLRSAGVRVPLYRQLGLTYAAHSLSVTLPGGTAFSTRLNYQQMRRFGASPAVASWCIALSGILSAAALGVISAAGAIAAHGTPSWGTLAALGIAALLATIGVRQVARHPDAVQPLIRAVLRWVNRLRRRPPGDGLDRVSGFVYQMGLAKLSPAHAAAVIVYALLNWLLDAACLWLCFYAVTGVTISVTAMLLVFCAGMAAGTINLVPGGLGIIDSALILGLVTSGVDPGTAIATVVLYRLISFGFIIGTGWIAWLLIQRSGWRSASRRAADTPGARWPRTPCADHPD